MRKGTEWKEMVTFYLKGCFKLDFKEISHFLHHGQALLHDWFAYLHFFILYCHLTARLRIHLTFPSFSLSFSDWAQSLLSLCLSTAPSHVFKSLSFSATSQSQTSLWRTLWAHRWAQTAFTNHIHISFLYFFKIIHFASLSQKLHTKSKSHCCLRS